MKPASQSLVFTPTQTSLVISIAAVLIVAALAWLAWHRSGYRTSTGLLEALRVLIVAAIAITLNQPEWREIFEPEHKRTLVVLADTSRSMETRDVIDTANPAGELKSRARSPSR
jgi:hypothetical protein